MIKNRSEVSQADQWNVEALYSSIEEWEREFAVVAPVGAVLRWPDVAAYKGRLKESPETLKALFDLFFDYSRRLAKLYTYAHLRHDEDITEDAHKTAFGKMSAAVHDFMQESSWIEPELLSIDDESIDKTLALTVLDDYRFHIEKSIRVKKHMLSEECEQLLAMAGKALQSPMKAFSAINDADFKFGKILDSKGNEKELTRGTYGLFMRDQDRQLRENAFMKMHGKYKSYENTLCELLSGEMQTHVFNAKARHYSSSLEAALFPKNIDTAVYHALIQAVDENLHILHDYVDLRQNVMDVGSLHLYDMYVPLIKAVDIRLSYREAEEIVIESVAPLGPEYQNILRRGLKDERWVDRYENNNKRSGAYSSGCFDSMPYILMNYKEILRDVFTLAHEAGHSMHSLYSHKHQPYQYSDYPIFLAEVASTFNEELLMHHMLQRVKTKEERVFLLNEKIEDIRGTLFRQTMFAEFELWLHTMVEQNTPLTPALLNDAFRKLNHRYFGEKVIIDPEAEVEWSRIPHFYYNFYVFQYATGISAALALAERVVHGGVKERDEYLSFLKAGSSRYPIEILQSAGVDMRSPKPVAAAIGKFGSLVKQLRSELIES